MIPLLVLIISFSLSTQQKLEPEVLAQDMLNGKRIDLINLLPQDKICLSKVLLSMLDKDSIQLTNKHYWKLTSQKDIANIECKIDACFSACAEIPLFPGVKAESERERETRCQACHTRREAYFSKYYLSRNMTIFYLIEVLRLSSYEFEQEIDIVSVYKDSLAQAYYVPVEKDSAFFRELEGYYRQYLDTVSAFTFTLSAKSCQASPLYTSAYRWYSPKVAAAMEAQAQPILNRISKEFSGRDIRYIELVGASPASIISRYWPQNMPLYFGAPCL